MKSMIQPLLLATTLGMIACQADQTQTSKSLGDSRYDALLSSAQGIVACFEAGDGNLSQTEFDETGECENGINIWTDPSDNMTITASTRISYGTEYEGRKIGAVRFFYQRGLRQEVCGFMLDVSHSEEDIVVELTSAVECSPRRLLESEITATIESIECGEIDPFAIGDACVVKAETSEGDRIALIGHDYDLLTNNGYDYDDLPGLYGMTFSVKSSDLAQVGEPDSLAEARSYIGEDYAPFWWNSAWELGADISLPGLKYQAYRIAQPIAENLGLTVVAECVGDSTVTAAENDDVTGYNVAFGDENDCDPHNSVDIFFDRDGLFLRSVLVDI